MRSGLKTMVGLTTLANTVAISMNRRDRTYKETRFGSTTKCKTPHNEKRLQSSLVLRQPPLVLESRLPWPMFEGHLDTLVERTLRPW
eukprot:1326865-Amphidinium_carterae.1